VKAKFQPTFPPNLVPVVHLSNREERARVKVLEELLELEKEEKHLEDQIERRRLLRKELLERLNQVPRRN
jgi:galactose-1-phosphate uridylyltransferase